MSSYWKRIAFCLVLWGAIGCEREEQDRHGLPEPHPVSLPQPSPDLAPAAPATSAVDVAAIRAQAEALQVRAQKLREALPAREVEVPRCEGEQPEATILSASQLGALTQAPLDRPVEPYAEGSWQQQQIHELSELLSTSESWDEARAVRFESAEALFSPERGVAVVQAIHVRAPSSHVSWEYSSGLVRGRVLHFDPTGELRCASYYEAWNVGTLTAQQGGLVGAAKNQLVDRVEAAVKESFHDNLVPPTVVADAETGNLEGTIYYGKTPLKGHEVKLCTTFDPYWAGCGGKTYKARTDDYGRFLIAGLKPGKYQGLLMRDANKRGWIYTTGSYGIGNAVVAITAGETTFWGRTQNFRSALQITSPKKNAVIPAQGAVIVWKAYPDAARYTLGVNEEFDMKRPTDHPYLYKSYKDITATEFTLPEPLNTGSKYQLTLVAFDDQGNKLADLKGGDFKVKVSK